MLGRPRLASPYTRCPIVHLARSKSTKKSSFKSNLGVGTALLLAAVATTAKTNQVLPRAYYQPLPGEPALRSREQRVAAAWAAVQCAGLPELARSLALDGRPGALDPTLVVCSGVPLRSSWLLLAAGDMDGAPAVGENSKATGANKRKAPGQALPTASPLHCLPLIKSHNAGCGDCAAPAVR